MEKYPQLPIIKSIPTIGPRGIQFRSRIEARWAYVFEVVGWKWEYEPIDLDGYIPDFIITFPNKTQLLVEVKGDMDIWSTYEPHEKKIIISGWKGFYLIVGSTVKEGEYFSQCPLIGIGGCTNDIDVFTGQNLNDGYVLRMIHDAWSIGGEWNSYDLGLGDICQDGKEWKRISGSSYKEFMKIWVDSQNKAQWKGVKNTHISKYKTHKAMLNLDRVDLRYLEKRQNYKFYK